MVMRGDGLEPVKSSGRHIGGGAVATIAGVALLVIFVAQNTQDVKFDFLFWSVTIPIWLLSILMAGVGALIFFGLGVLRRHRRRQARRD
ncbi:MAG: LapA family protein [Acidimicrobiia bacterium]